MTPGPVIPPLAAVPRPALPDATRWTLPNGLRVVAVRRPSVPMVELRLWIPWPAWPAVGRMPAATELLAETMLAGTRRRTGLELSAALQGIGGGLAASADPDRLGLAGSALSAELAALLDVLADVLGSASYPGEEILAERERLAQGLEIDVSRPDVLARTVMLAGLYGAGHPYVAELPPAGEVREVTPELLRDVHARVVSPAGAVLVLVGDLDIAQARAETERALGEWRPPAGVRATPPEKPAAPPPVPADEPRTCVLVHRADATQANIRLAVPVPGQCDPRYPALELANLITGGYLSSRLFRRLRDELGYAYRVYSSIEHARAGSRLIIEVDVASRLVARTLAEVRRELARLTAERPDEEELRQARDFAAGGLALETASQVDVAMLLFRLVPFDLDLAWVDRHFSALANVGTAGLAEVAGEFLAPDLFVTAVVADAAATGEVPGLRLSNE